MNHYERLGAERDADFAALKKAFYKRAKECHPDLFGNSLEKTEEFKLLVAAFDVLSDPDKRRRYDEAFKQETSPASTPEPGRPETAPEALAKFSVMDSDADDTLEELIVGNRPPSDATLATLFLDLERTLVFMTFREGKNFYAQRRYREAETQLRQAVAMAPENILYRVYFARCLAFRRNLSEAKTHYKAALAIGERRIPVQRLVRVRRELEAVGKMQAPLWSRIAGFFAETREESWLSPDEEMIEQTNRAIARLAREQEREARKRLK